MNTIKLSRKFELKYKLANYQGELGWIKRQVRDAIDNYIVNPPSAFNIIPLLAQRHNFAPSKELIKMVAPIYDNLEALSAEELFEQINGVLGLIKKFQTTSRKNIRNKIHDLYKKQTDREIAKNKFEEVVFSKFTHEFSSAAEELKTRWKIPGKINAYPIDPQRKELSKQEMWMWIHGHPAAIRFGLDNEDVFAKIYEDLELRHDLTTIIYATKRAKNPASPGKVLEAVKELMEVFRQRQTNEELLEGGDEAEELRQQIIAPEEYWSNKMQEAKKEKALERAEEEQAQLEKARLAPLIQQRDEEFEKRKQIEEDRERHIRSEGSFLLRALLKKRYL